MINFSKCKLFQVCCLYSNCVGLFSVAVVKYIAGDKESWGFKNKPGNPVPPESKTDFCRRVVSKHTWWVVCPIDHNAGRALYFFALAQNLVLLANRSGVKVSTNNRGVGKLKVPFGCFEILCHFGLMEKTLFVTS